MLCACECRGANACAVHSGPLRALSQKFWLSAIALGHGVALGPHSSPRCVVAHPKSQLSCQLRQISLLPHLMWLWPFKVSTLTQTLAGGVAQQSTGALSVLLASCPYARLGWCAGGAGQK